MTKFLRDNTLGILLLSVLGGVLAAWLSQILPSPISDGAWWRNLLFQPVPAFVLLSYSVFLVFALLAASKRWHRAELARIEAERADLTAQVGSLSKDRESLKKQLDALRRKTVARETLMRFAALVLADKASSGRKTYLDICKGIAGLAGQGVPHAEIGDALGTMLQIGAVRAGLGEFELASDWEGRVARYVSEQDTLST